MRLKNRFIAIVLFMIMIGTCINIPEEKVKAEDSNLKEGNYGLSNPVWNDDGSVTWDCIWFGNYSGPIKWRVLQVNGNDAFLLADKALLNVDYNNLITAVTWETCSLRKYLNSNFHNSAFSSKEQTAIIPTKVINEDNPVYGTEGGNDTIDKVYLLSIAEATNTDYGFSENYNATPTRVASGVDGAKYWRLRSPGRESTYNASMDYDGELDPAAHDVSCPQHASRPVIHLDLSHLDCWSNAGTVCSNGEVHLIDQSNERVVNGADIAIDTTVTADDLFEKYPAALHNPYHNKLITIVYNNCAGAVDIYNSDFGKTLWASFKYGLTDGPDVLVDSIYGGIFGNNKVYRDFIDAEVEDLMVAVSGSDWLLEEAIENVEDKFDTTDLIKDIAGNSYDAAQKKKLIKALVDSGYFNKYEAKKLCKSVEENFEEIDSTFEAIDTTISIADAIITIAQVTSIKIEMVDTVMESIPKNTDFYDSLKRLKKKMTSEEYLAWSIGEEKIFDEIASFIATSASYGGIRSYSNIMLKDATPAIFFGKLATNIWAKMLSVASADALVKANMNNGIFVNLAGAVDSKYVEIIKLKKNGASEAEIAKAQAEYEILYTAHIEALSKAVDSARNLMAPTTAEKIFSFFGITAVSNSETKRYYNSLSEDVEVMRYLSYDNYIKSCLSLYVKENATQYLYSVQDGEATIIGCMAPSNAVSEVENADTIPVMAMSIEEPVGMAASAAQETTESSTYGKIVAIPHTIGTVPVTAIESGTFSGKLSDAIVILPDSIEEIAADSFDVGANILIVGNQSQGVEECATTTNNVAQVIERKVTNIEIISLPDKTTYTGGEMLDETGMRLKIVYSDGTQKEVSKGWFSIIEERTIGTNVVNVSYADCSTAYEVTVVEGEVSYTVYYRDEQGNDLIEQADFTGTIGSNIDVQAENIPFYTPKQSSINVTLDDNTKVSFAYIADSTTSIAKANVFVIGEQYYTGEQIFPDIKVVLDGIELKKDVDYDVDYFSNVEVGTAEILVWGKGLYSDEATVTFEIQKPLRTVVFEYDNGTKDVKKQVKQGEMVDEPETPTKNGYEFDGWYYKNQNRKYDFSSPVEEDIILIAMWKKVQDTEGITDKEQIIVGEKYTINSNIYIITNSDKINPTVAWVGPKDSSKKNIKIPADIKIDGIKYKVTSIAKNACKGNKKIKKVAIGENVVIIGKNAFSGCSELKKITIGKNVTTIEAKAFYKCKALTKITIPKHVSEIEKNAFNSCKKLKKITIKSAVLKSVGKNAIKDIHKKATIKVPKKQLSKYKKLFKSKTGYKKTMKIKK